MLTEHAPPHALDVALKDTGPRGAAWQPAERAVDLVKRALRGGPYTRMHCRVAPYGRLSPGRAASGARGELSNR